MEFKEKLQKIQFELKAPKNMRNKIVNYNYRSAEGILEAAKPLLQKYNLILTLSDEIVVIGQHVPIVWERTVYDKYAKKDVDLSDVLGMQRIYVKATATLTDVESDGTTQVSALARESEIKKVQDDSQMTGTSSSYARKYALNGLFLLDDTKDSDIDGVCNDNEEPNKVEKITPAEIKVVEKMLFDLKWKVEDVFSKPIAELTKEEYGKSLQVLRANLEKLKGSK